MFADVLKRVFGHFRYVLVAGIVAFAIVSAAILLPNRVIIQQVLFSDSSAFSDKVLFVFNMLGTLATNFSLLTASYLFLVAIVFGINVSLLTFYIRRRQEVSHTKRVHLASIGGFVSAVLGIGCIACGSVILTAVFGLVGAGVIITFLPFHGLEFGVIGISLLLVSTFYLVKKIHDPIVCPID